MAVQAVFQADFTAFNAGVQGAEAKLRTFEGTSKTTEAALQKMTSTAASGAAPAEQLGSVYKQFDGILASLGIHIGPQVKGLQDLASAASGSSSALATLGTAAAAAYVVWQTYKWADAFFALNPAITDSISLILGWGSAIGEAGAAKLDTLTRASQVAGREITSLSEAVKILEEAQRKSVATGIDWVEKLGAAQREVRNLSAAQKDEIAIAQQAGATTQQLTDKYGISKQGLEELARSNKVTADAVSKHTAEMDKAAAAAAKLDAEYAKLMSDANNRAGLMKMEADAEAMAVAAKAQSQHTVNLLQNAYGELSKQQAAAKASAAELGATEQMLEADYQATVVAAQQLTAAHSEVGAAAEAGTQVAVAGYQQVQQQVALTTDSVRAMIALNAYSAKANAILSEGLYTTASQRERVANLPMPAFGGGGGGSTINNTFHLVDTQDNLAQKVSDTILRTVRSGTQLGTT